MGCRHSTAWDPRWEQPRDYGVGVMIKAAMPAELCPSGGPVQPWAHVPHRGFARCGHVGLTKRRKNSPHPKCRGPALLSQDGELQKKIPNSAVTAMRNETST